MAAVVVTAAGAAETKVLGSFESRYGVLILDGFHLAEILEKPRIDIMSDGTTHWVGRDGELYVTRGDKGPTKADAIRLGQRDNSSATSLGEADAPAMCAVTTTSASG